MVGIKQHKPFISTNSSIENAEYKPIRGTKHVVEFAGQRDIKRSLW